MSEHGSINVQRAGEIEGVLEQWVMYWVRVRKAKCDEHSAAVERLPRFSLLAVGLIFLVGFAWSLVAASGFMNGDPHYYYDMIVEHTWLQYYPYEPSMYVLFHFIPLWSFPSYIFSEIAVSLLFLLLAFRRLRYAPIDQLVLTLFFSCSFYGLHFMVAFHRQFLGIVFFLLAIAGGRGSMLARVASVFSHLYTFSLHIFWALGRFSAALAVAVALTLVSLVSVLGGSILAEKSRYGVYGESNALHLLVKQSLTVLIAVLILLTIERGKNSLRSVSIVYIALSLPVALWPYYAGVFSRLDYFFFPILVALWPGYIRKSLLPLCRISLVCLTVIGFYLWFNANLACEVMGYCAE